MILLIFTCSLFFWAICSFSEFLYYLDSEEKLSAVNIKRILLAPLDWSYERFYMRLVVLTLVFLIFGLSLLNHAKSSEELLTEKEIKDLFTSHHKGNSPAKEIESYDERVKNLTPLKDFVTSDKIQKLEMAVDFAKLPNSVDQRKMDSKVKSQWNGTCTSFGMTAVREHLACSVLKKCGLDLSERHFWSFYEQYSADAAIVHANKYVALDSSWPQNVASKPSGVDKLGVYSIPKFTYGNMDINLLMWAIANGKAVYFWSQVPKEMGECRVGISSREFLDGGHAYKVSGYINKNDPVIIVKNSWGEGCGNKGYQYLKLSVFNQRSSYGTGYFNFAFADNIVEKKFVKENCKEVCKPKWWIFGKVCENVCD